SRSASRARSCSAAGGTYGAAQRWIGAATVSSVRREPCVRAMSIASDRARFACRDRSQPIRMLLNISPRVSFDAPSKGRGEGRLRVGHLARLRGPGDAGLLAARDDQLNERRRGVATASEGLAKEKHGQADAIFSRWLRPRASTAFAWTGATSSLALSEPNAAP